MQKTMRENNLLGITFGDLKAMLLEAKGNPDFDVDEALQNGISKGIIFLANRFSVQDKEIKGFANYLRKKLGTDV